MLGAIIGDLAGSIYEYDQVKNCHSIKINEIIEKDSFFSDDTILTVAIADAILNCVDYETKLKEYAIAYDDKIPQNIEAIYLDPVTGKYSENGSLFYFLKGTIPK